MRFAGVVAVRSSNQVTGPPACAGRPKAIVLPLEPRRWSYPRLAVAAPALAFVSTLIFVGYITFFYVSAWCLAADAEF